ncbi:hypothetical protein T484DRAFT_2976665 [Baffinella frigidus]|nr:hypothetical protein T484DRAFT_2976665 [Cryptophyta sp. CCMP2293]
MCVCVCVCVCVSVRTRARAREGERGRDGWMEGGTDVGGGPSSWESLDAEMCAGAPKRCYAATGEKYQIYRGRTPRSSTCHTLNIFKSFLFFTHGITKVFWDQFCPTCFYLIRRDLPMSLPYPTVLPTVGPLDYSLTGYSRNPFQIRLCGTRQATGVPRS